MDNLIQDSMKKYNLMLDLLFEVGNSIRGLNAGYDDRLLDARGILIKFFNHCGTIKHLMNKTRYKIKENNILFLDFSSIDVIARSAIETFFVLYYVFNEPDNEVEKELRYNAWLMSGLISRMSFIPTSEKSKNVLAQDNKIHDNVKKILENNIKFKNLTEKQQKNIIEKGKWKLEGEYNGKMKIPSWIDIGISAGIDKTKAREIYIFLSGYTHCDSLSIIKIRDCYNEQNRKILTDGTLEIMIMIIAFMIKSLASIFPKTENVLKEKNVRTELYELVITTFLTN